MLKRLYLISIISLAMLPVTAMSIGKTSTDSTVASKPLKLSKKTAALNSNNPPTNSNNGALHRAALSFAPVVKKVSSSVVNIYSERVQVAQTAPFSNPMMQMFLGRGMNFDSLFTMPREFVQRSLGSGVIIGKEGTILTNVHVIKDATKIKVILHDGRQYDAKVIVKDDKIDLAVLKIQKPTVKLIPIDIGDPEEMEVGDLVVAIGNPFGVGTTVTTGIVSAISRFGGFIQTDASINVGNSGGALVNMKGELIGINNFIISKSGTSAGIGFAIPINMSKPALAQLKKGGGDVKRGWSGLVVQTITPSIAKTLNMDIPVGVVVNAVHPLRPAKQIKVGDVIVAMNGKPLFDKESFYYRLAGIPVGETVSIDYKHLGKLNSTSFKLIKPVESPSRQRTTLKGSHLFNGLVVANLSPALEADLNLDSMRRGVIVLGAVAQTPILRLLQRYDVIHMINKHIILSVNDVLKVLKSEKVTSVKLIRNGKTIEIR